MRFPCWPGGYGGTARSRSRCSAFISGPAPPQWKIKEKATFFGPLRRKAVTKTVGLRVALPFFGGGLQHHPCERAVGGRFLCVCVPGLVGALLQRRPRRTAALFAGAGAGEEEENEKYTTLSPHQHAPRRDHPVLPPPPSRSNRRLSYVTALYLAALRFRPVAIAIAIVVMVAVVAVVVPCVTPRRVACACARMT